ncbi:hypothetical protein DL93DRAFT_1467868 [Clavulina sp. PMI_390]|nr:hypothetical protein DL93DRAFT_1467868 [Clavulina sp. PMI_390]
MLGLSAEKPAEVCEAPAVKNVNPLNPTGVKACCACPETKSARDECFMKNDPSAATEACRDLVAKHIACMKGYGFTV